MILLNSWSTFSLFIILVVTLEKASSISDEEIAWKEFQEFREWKKWKNQWNNQERYASKIEDVSSSNEEDSSELKKTINVDDIREAIDNQSNEIIEPPPSDQPALMGRYIVNQADWTSVATISSRKDIATFPFANVISFSDGPLGNGTGIPYMYLTPLDFTAQDLARDHRATLMMTLAQGSYCKAKAMDPMDPRCARIVLSGKIKAVKPDSWEYPVAKAAVFGRHPWFANLPADHHFFFATLKISSIAVLDAFGGPKYVTVKDYLHPPTTKDHRHGRRYDNRENRDRSYDSIKEDKFTSRI